MKTRKPLPASALDKMTPNELADILHNLLMKHPELLQEAKSIAVDMVSSPSMENIADFVLIAVTSPSIDALHGRAGKQPWGYVEPTEAAWEILSETIEDMISDMKRCIELGLQNAAETICCGIVLGLFQADGIGSEGLLGWAPDFPSQEACQTVDIFVKTWPARKRLTACNRLFSSLNKHVPEWSEMISRYIRRDFIF